MTMRERTGTRDLTYSRWHRPDNLHKPLMARLAVPKWEAWRIADSCTVIDIDWCEYCKKCRQPLALIETQQGANPKPAEVTTNLANMAGIPAYSLSYRVDNGEIVGFRMRQVAPSLSTVQDFTPEAWAEWLVRLHDQHNCQRT